MYFHNLNLPQGRVYYYRKEKNRLRLFDSIYYYGYWFKSQKKLELKSLYLY